MKSTRTNWMSRSVAVGVLLAAGAALAGEDIPQMVGTWTVSAEGGVVIKKDSPSAITHHEGTFSSLKAEAVVTKQQGRVFHGTFTSPKATEQFIGAIGPDNKSFHFADEDGTMDGTLVDANTIEVVYRHVGEKDTVLAVGTWTRTP